MVGGGGGSGSGGSGGRWCAEGGKCGWLTHTSVNEMYNTRGLAGTTRLIPSFESFVACKHLNRCDLMTL